MTHRTFKSTRCALAVGLSALGLWGQAQAASFLGIVYPATDATLSVQVGGVVAQTHVRVGQRVKPRDPLLRLAADVPQVEVKRRELIANNRAALDAAQQRVGILKAMLSDAERLLKAGGVISQDEVRKLRLEWVVAQGDLAAAQTDHARQQEELRLARAELDQYQLRAPVSGVITDFQPEVGEWVAPGDAIVRLVDASVCEVYVKVSILAASVLKNEKTASVKIHDPRGDFVVDGKVSYVSPVADAASSLVDVRVRVANADGRIRPGSKATLDVRGIQ